MLKERMANVWGKLTRKYRLVVYDDDTLSQTRAFRVKPITLWVAGAGSVLVIAFLSGLVLAYFPAFQRSIPGLIMGNSEEYQQLQSKNLELERQVVEMDSMLQVLHNAMGAGEKGFASATSKMYEALPEEEMSDVVPAEESQENVQPPAEAQATPPKGSGKDFWAKAEQLMEAKRKGLPATSAQPASAKTLTQSEVEEKLGPAAWSLVPPVDGYLSEHYGFKQGLGFGVGIVANENAMIRAIADGVVIFSDYSTRSGYVVGIWHSKLGLISFYKQNSRLLKPLGTYVYAGEAIAVIGSTGTEAPGTQLRFELWRDNLPVDPGAYITLN